MECTAIEDNFVLCLSRQNIAVNLVSLFGLHKQTVNINLYSFHKKGKYIIVSHEDFAVNTIYHVSSSFRAVSIPKDTPIDHLSRGLSCFSFMSLSQDPHENFPSQILSHLT